MSGNSPSHSPSDSPFHSSRPSGETPVSFDLSIVLPCYNESDNLHDLISRLDLLISKRPIQIVLVNNGSQDASAEVFAHELGQVQSRSQFKLVHIEHNQGYGNGILTGLRQAEGRLLGWSHADLQFDPKNLIQAYELYLHHEKLNSNQGKFVVKGLRTERREREKPFSSGLDQIASWVMNSTLRDINGQPKIFSRNFYSLFRDTAPLDLSLDTYWMARAAKCGYIFFTIPVYFAERVAGESSWNTTRWSKAKTVGRFLKTIAKIRIESLRW